MSHVKPHVQNHLKPFLFRQGGVGLVSPDTGDHGGMRFSLTKQEISYRNNITTQRGWELLQVKRQETTTNQIQKTTGQSKK